jgi:propionyl-CoA carboxylase alpha chain
MTGHALVKMTIGGKEQRIQSTGSKNDIEYSFYYRGAHRTVNVYDQQQYDLAKHMPTPKSIDLDKVILSPMPGAIVSVNVEVGQEV